MGDAPKQAAETVKLRVECLVAASIAGSPVDPDTARWLANIGDPLAKKLAKVGLVDAREPSVKPAPKPSAHFWNRILSCAPTLSRERKTILARIRYGGIAGVRVNFSPPRRRRN